MKVIAVMLAVSLSAMLSCGPGVPTQDAGPVNNTQAVPVPVTDGNNNTTTPVTSLSSTKLNPAHGQPGHRCDIAVGQPLNSKPAAAVNPLTTATTPIAKPAVTPSSPFVTPGVKTNTTPAILPTSAAGLNPAHGQPGHRCDIQVGQPLNSKPFKPSTTALPTLPASNVPAPTVTPAAATPVAPGMNPKHGQPGHRCDIAVGQPLNSKPAPGK